ncbi:hypothetical protein LX32DRAFT_644398 [Colletotrichum zoysiae]|uniref:Uncharacterized protein n=1 Tax=Colletotrichum zoysiae TaxID=1216348 RepID=A0AAD9LZ56_9PEZI|nr:hypothetical protein LX32DRAFT_644398 [Colletotrichum zoysiae]
MRFSHSFSWSLFAGWPSGQAARRPPSWLVVEWAEPLPNSGTPGRTRPNSPKRPLPSTQLRIPLRCLKHGFYHVIRTRGRACPVIDPQSKWEERKEQFPQWLNAFQVSSSDTPPSTDTYSRIVSPRSCSVPVVSSRPLTKPSLEQGPTLLSKKDPEMNKLPAYVRRAGGGRAPHPAHAR